MALAAPGPPTGHLVRGPSLSAPERKVYLDWLRGVAVIVMVMAHVTDAWTRDGDRQGGLYRQVVFVAGLAAPLFLFLAGLSLSMAASTRSLAMGHAGAASLALTRGAQVFALAFLFRLQSQLIGWGALSNFLKVDILNIMGFAMMAAALLWRASESRAARVLLFALATIAVTMTTPLVREWGALAALPDPIEAYIRPLPGRTNFALFPWAAFLLAGAIAGEVIHAARARSQEMRLQWSLLAAGVAGIGLGYAASFQSSIYPVANFWTSSPTFFFIRLGICTVMVPVARAVVLYQEALPGWLGGYHSKGPPLATVLGRSSLFVYWIHVEMVYGLLARPLRRALPIGWSLVATAALCLLLYAIVLWKDRLMAGVKLTGPFRIFAPVLK
ncbi:MAG: heparan-alpha-glucosaminide N-acetyltransferase domain-containing protein [Acidobacteriota bacterium]|nr:heparan-alpha-glucosaminide N-acetyltransferase domain-containing protein [Acidobacteriota bacterium]